MQSSKWWPWIIKLKSRPQICCKQYFSFCFWKPCDQNWACQFFYCLNVHSIEPIPKYYPHALTFHSSTFWNVDICCTYFIKSVNAHPSTQFSTNVAPCLWVTNWPSRNRFPIDFCRVVFFSNLLYNTQYDWIISMLKWLFYLK